VGLELVRFWRVEGLDRKTGIRGQGTGNSKVPGLKPPAPSEGQGREFFRGVWEEGRSVVPAAPPLRPSAERKRLSARLLWHG